MGIVGDAEPQVPVGGHHRQGLEMHVAGDAVLCHGNDDPVALRLGDPGQPDQVQVIVAGPVCPDMFHALDIFWQKDGIVDLASPPAALDQPGEAFELLQAEGRHQVGHVAFVAGIDDVVFPGARIQLGRRILVLAVQAEQLELLVQGGIIQAGARYPCHGAALGGGQVLHRMEAEAGKVRDGT